jgi:predicted alpha/beta hydrolase
MSIAKRTLNISSDDGYQLSATLFSAAASASTGPVTIIGSATGVPQGYYARFATYLAEHGRPTLTFDARGIAKSAPPSLKGFQCRFRDWGILDFPGVIDWATAEAGGRPIHWIGHSYGGFGLGLARNNAQVSRLLGISTMSADARLVGNKLGALKIGLLLFAVGPLAARAFGYGPGKLFGGTDLPKDVVLEWSRWCRTPGFLFGVSDLPERRFFDTLTADIRLLRMTDDTWLGIAGVKQLCENFGHARSRDIIAISPADVNNRPIGHLGFFRSEFQDTLWLQALSWLDGGSRC